jgi:serine/threonine protein kinase
VSASNDSRIGREVAGYRIERVIAQGSVSVVYLAVHPWLGRKVALKLFWPELTSDELWRDRFAGESRRAAQLEHPNIVPIYDAGEAEGELFIAMRYVQGCDLKALIRREEQLSIRRTLFILEQIASALDALHDHELVYRDLKPADILIAEPSQAVYLTDFGAATASGARLEFYYGAADYLSPELLEGLPVDARTDVYGLGCVLYECLTGQAPFAGDDLPAIHEHLVTPPPLLTSARPDLPRSLNRVLANAMAKSKEDRYASCEELVDKAREAIS